MVAEYRNALKRALANAEVATVAEGRKFTAEARAAEIARVKAFYIRQAEQKAAA